MTKRPQWVDTYRTVCKNKVVISYLHESADVLAADDWIKYLNRLGKSIRNFVLKVVRVSVMIR